jgi:hypothetical protein
VSFNYLDKRYKMHGLPYQACTSVLSLSNRNSTSPWMVIDTPVAIHYSSVILSSLNSFSRALNSEEFFDRSSIFLMTESRYSSLQTFGTDRGNSFFYPT